MIALTVLFVALQVGWGGESWKPGVEDRTIAENRSTVLKDAQTPNEVIVSVREIKRNPERFRDRPVRIRGYGTIMATLHLCPGYLGFDTRCQFVDEAGDMIPAKVNGQADQSRRAIYRRGVPRLFKGYIRIFSGEMGCPESTTWKSFPWFEIVEVEF